MAHKKKFTCLSGQTRVFIIFACILFSLTELHGQVNKNQSNRRKIENMIREHQYKKALTHTRQLLDIFPRDPQYNYYQGICLVELKETPEKAIYHLRYASVKSVPVNVHIYLGRAYHLNYQFQEALSAYERFNIEAGWRERRKYQMEHYRSQTREAIVQTRQANQIKAFAKEKITTKNPVTQLKKKTSLHTSLPEDLSFIAPEDQNYLLRSKDVPFIIYASQNDRHDNMDLYILHPNSSPTPLPDIINSPRDEHHPYYDFNTNTLYFASKGHENMGGYDIFKTTYNPAQDKWSKPENLGFPVNSPFDELAYLPGSQKNWLITNRHLKYDQYHLFQLHPDKKTPVLISGQNKIKAFATIKIIKEKSPAKQSDPIKKATVETSAKDTAIKLHHIAQAQDINDYRELLSKGLKIEHEADSLRIKEKQLKKKWTDKQKKLSKTQQGTLYLHRSLAAKKTKTAASYFEEAYQYEEKLKKEITIQQDKQIKDNDKQQQNIIPEKKSFPKFRIHHQNHEFYDLKEIPQGIIYRVQLGAYSTPQEINFFQGIYPVMKESLEERGLTKYYAGIFDIYKKARKALDEIRKKGFSDAYIVSYLNGQKISTKRAINLEETGGL